MMKESIVNPKPNYTLKLFLVLLLAVVLPLSGTLDAAKKKGFKLPAYEKFKLANGLTVYLMEQHEVPLINVSMVLPAGAVKDGKQFGLASLTASALLFGTKNYTRKQIEEELDFLGANYSTSASLESASVTLSFVKTDLSKVFPILKEIVCHPVFDQAEFDKYKKRLMLQLEQRKERSGQAVYSYYSKFLFGDHVYGNPTSGSKKTVAGLTIKDLKSFYKNNYKPAESAIAVVGDFKSSEMKKKIKALFKDWKVKGKSSAVRSSTLPSFSKSRILLVNKEDANETSFLIGGVGVKQSNPDFVSINVINTFFGQRFTSWLNDELRVSAGLTYGAGSRFIRYKNSGLFLIRSETKTSTTTECIDLALKVLDRLHTKGVDQKTLDSAKNYVKGQFPPNFETSGALANLLTSMFVYGYNESFINDFEKNVDRLTLAKAKEVISKYFPKDNLQFVLIGKASEIKDKVKKYGELTEKEIKSDGF